MHLEEWIAYGYYASEWVIRIVMLIVVPFRRSPDAAKGWLLLIFFQPWVGLVIYFLIGRPTLPRWRLERVADMREKMQAVRHRIMQSPAIKLPKLDPELSQPVRLATRLGTLPPFDGNQSELLPDYIGAINRLVADIDAARQHVHLLYYIFADDAVTAPVIAALGRAVARGVKCRVLFDFLGSKRWRDTVLAKLTAAKVEVHTTLPVGWFRRSTGRIDLRNHRKIAVIDGRIGYTGSQNLVDPTFKPGIVYQELVVRVVGPVALALQGVFASDWYLETGELLDTLETFPDPEAAGNGMVQALPSGPTFSTRNTQRLIVSLIHASRHRVVLTTPYFIPDAALEQALETAVKRGVEVHLVVSKQRDQMLVGLAQASYYDSILERGVHIHQYHEKFLHAKHASFDDTIALIGSSNLDIRSFVLNNEISLLFYDDGIAKQLRVEQERYFAGSEELKLEVWRQRSRLTRFAENMARLMSPLL